eukprot:scaffold5326_cov191-Amphora_coffeaeformis.AAC.3
MKQSNRHESNKSNPGHYVCLRQCTRPPRVIITRASQQASKQGGKSIDFHSMHQYGSHSFPTFLTFQELPRPVRRISHSAKCHNRDDRFRRDVPPCPIPDSNDVGLPIDPIPRPCAWNDGVSWI